MAYNFNLPFRLATGSGYFEVTTDVLPAVASNIRSILLTNRGERPMQYDFGCNLREFLFEQTGDPLRRRVADRIILQVGRYIPYVEISELNVLFPTDDPALQQNSMFVRIVFRLASDPQRAETIEQIIT